jgi:Zn-dependent peptidase ImmA (M78 family)/transcriptional regulator with XRE-family HTH domain
MTTAVKLPVVPSVLKWVRESAGLEVAEAAELLHIDPRALEALEAGTNRPSLSVGRELARSYRRPLAALLLHRPKTGPPLPVDFRAVAGDRSARLSRDTLIALRRARRVQGFITDVYSALDRNSSVAVASVNLSDDPEDVAAKVRARLGVGLIEQFDWVGIYQALRRWRAAVEADGVIVLQASMPLDEVRGFSLSEAGIPTIALNVADPPQARIFTLFHEYSHLLLGSGGLCIPERQLYVQRSVVTERFCNAFAGNLLVPSDALKSHPRLGPIVEAKGIPSDSLLTPLANSFAVSRQVIWYRLFETSLISKTKYAAKWPEWISQRKIPQKAGSGPKRSAARKSFDENGPAVVGAVLEAYDRKIIGLNDTTDWLDVRTKDLEPLEALVLRSGNSKQES